MSRSLLGLTALGLLLPTAIAETWGLVPGRLLSPEAWRALGPGAQLAPLGGHLLVHAGVAHLLGNLWCLYLFGAKVEARLGPLRFAALYLGAALVAALTQVAAEPSSLAPMIGASGAVAGVLGAYLVFFPRARVTLLAPLPMLYTVKVPAALLLGAWALLQLLLATATQGAHPGVAFWAHVGGVAVGVAASARPLVPRWRSA